MTLKGLHVQEVLGCSPLPPSSYFEKPCGHLDCAINFWLQRDKEHEVFVGNHMPFLFLYSATT